MMDFVFKMVNFVLQNDGFRTKMMDFVLKMVNVVLQMMDFVLK